MIHVLRRPMFRVYGAWWSLWHREEIAEAGRRDDAYLLALLLRPKIDSYFLRKLDEAEKVVVSPFLRRERRRFLKARGFCVQIIRAWETRSAIPQHWVFGILSEPELLHYAKLSQIAIPK